jgi:leucyl-tRNA synthetase
MKYDYLVVGAGLYGAVFARQAANAGKKVLVIDKRDHIAGNVYTEEMEGMRPNTAIAKMIVLNNHLTSLEAVPREAAEALVLMVSPIAPHIAEELWARLGHEDSLAHEPFTTVTDESLLVDDTVTCVVQVKGKLRDRLEVSADASEEDLTRLALASSKVQKYLEGEPRRVIVRAPKLVNIVP